MGVRVSVTSPWTQVAEKGNMHIKRGGESTTRRKNFGGEGGIYGIAKSGRGLLMEHKPFPFYA